MSRNVSSSTSAATTATTSATTSATTTVCVCFNAEAFRLSSHLRTIWL